MITAKELIKIGFHEIIDETNFRYYVLSFKSPFNFGVDSISGEFTETGKFKLWSNNTEYDNVHDLNIVIGVLGNVKF